MKRKRNRHPARLPELRDLRRRLADTEETLRAIRQGEVDGLLVETAEGEQVFTLTGADQPYRRLIEDMNEGAVTVIPDGTILYCNRRFAEMLNIPLHKVIGSSFGRFLPRQERRAFSAMLQHSAGDGSYKGEFSLKVQVGTPVAAQLSLRSLKLDNLSAIGIVVTDITERKRAEAVRSLLATLVEHAEDAMIGKTLDGVIYSWNPGAEKMYGYSAKEMIGRSISVLVPPHLRAEVPWILERIKAGETVGRYETVRMRKDGKPIQVSVTISPIKDAKGKVTSAVAVTRDITERKELEQKILEVSEWEQQLAGQHLHDGLSQHLTGVAYMGDVLKEKLAAKALKEAHDAERITELLQQALILTRKMTVDLYPVKKDPQGLMSALQELAASVQTTYDTSCRFVCETPVLIHDNVAATHLYRIAHEAILGAVQNGKPRTVRICLERSNDDIELRVEITGTDWLLQPSKRKNLAFEIMNYRARALRGSLDVRRRNGRKTILSCLVPAGNGSGREEVRTLNA